MSRSSTISISFQTWYGSTQIGFVPEGCDQPSNVLLMSLILFFGTFVLIILLRKFKTSSYLTSKIRSGVADFAVIVAVLTWTLVDKAVGVETPKLVVPSTIQPSLAGRGWVVDAFGSNPWWTPFAAFIPALLATILVFMDQQITVVIVNRKEHLLKVIWMLNFDIVATLTLPDLAERLWISLGPLHRGHHGHSLWHNGFSLL